MTTVCLLQIWRYLILTKIERKDWVAFISQRFADTGKQISDELSGMIADKMKNHPYYTQQLSQQTWLRTSSVRKLLSMRRSTV